MKQPKPKSGLMGRCIRRLLLVVFTAGVLVCGALALMLNLVFNGPSPAARDAMSASLSQSVLTQWIPDVFLSMSSGNPDA